MKPAFEEMVELSDKKIKEVIKDLDAEDLVAALNDAQEELINKVLPNLSKAARAKYEKTKTAAGKVSKTQVKKIRALIEEKMQQIIK